MSLLKKKKTMHKLHSSVEFDNLLYHYKGSTKDIDFGEYDDAKSLFNMIKNKHSSLFDAEKNQD